MLVDYLNALPLIPDVQSYALLDLSLPRGDSHPRTTTPPRNQGDQAPFLGKAQEQLPPSLPFANCFADHVLAQLAPTQPAPCPRPLSLGAAQELYTRSLGGASQVMGRANMLETVLRRNALGRELQAFLATNPPPLPNLLATARPQEVLVFMQSQFILGHAGSLLPGMTDPVASPSGVSGALSHFATLFEELGRRGPYDETTGSGNPCDSHEVKRYKQGYTRVLQEAGYQESSAVPLTKPKADLLLAYLDQQIELSASPFQKLSLARDALLCLFAWDSAMRGKEGEAPNHSSFKEAPYSTSSFIHRIHKHLGDSGLDNRETSHSFRRGTLQATSQAAIDSSLAISAGRAAAAQHGRIKTPHIVDLYLSPHRHWARFKP
eukprot:gene26376-biopygen11331